MAAADNTQSASQRVTTPVAPDATSAIAKDSHRPVAAASKAADMPNVPSVAVAKNLPKTVCSECRIVVETHHSGSGSAFIAYAPSLISGALVIAGWFVVNKAQANRERRKQIREFVAGLIKDLTELEKVIIQYHTTQRDKSAEQALISKLTRFEKSCGLLPKFVASQSYWRATLPDRLTVSPSVIQQMRKAMTLKHFSDEHEAAVDCADPLIQEIEIATNEVQEALEAVRLASLD